MPVVIRDIESTSNVFIYDIQTSYRVFAYNIMASQQVLTREMRSNYKVSGVLLGGYSLGYSNGYNV